MRPHTAGQAFDSGIGEIYAFFDYSNLAEGTAYSTTWSCDGEALLAEELQWQGIGGSGSYWLPISARDELPDGDWKLELSIEGKTAREGAFVVGGNAVATEEGVQLMGQILDADSKRPIGGAGFYVLNSGVDPEAFLEDPQESMIYDWATADRQGQFAVDRLLVRGKTYALVAGAKGYQPAVKEDYTVAKDAESPVELTVRLQKR